MKKQSATLISKLLNKNSQPTLQKEGKIVMLDARELVTNPKNGNILAMVSYPSFDPAQVEARWEEYTRSGEDGVLINREELFKAA